MEDGWLPRIAGGLFPPDRAISQQALRRRAAIDRGFLVRGRREMATRLQEVDAVMVGMGWTGSILARELAKAGLTVVGLERGEDLTPRENFALPAVRDELRYSYRLELIQDPALETVTFRHRPSESALPMRRFGSFLPGNSVGGAANHWGGQHWRYLPSDHLTRSHIVERYSAKSIPDDMTIQDWAMTYDELEPYYDKFDKLCGVSGKAGNLRGQKIEGGNVFEGPRSNEYPTPPLIMGESGLMFAKVAKELGYHPFPQPASNASRAYTNSEGLTLGGCQYCGFCERNGCEANAKAGPHVCVLPVLRADPKFTLRARAWVSRLSYDKAAKKVTGVVFTDTRTGEEYEQPAGLVVLSAYVFGNISAPAQLRHRRALRSGHSKGRGRQKLLLSALAVRCDAVLRGQGVQSVHGLARHAG